MAPFVEEASFELHVLRAAADGVEPALLLRAPGKKAEYLFNVPDGFSRLALEHKLIPSAQLSCVLLTSLRPKSTGGFGGFFLRLKHDGHGQIQVIGPKGSSRIIHSLRHICRWQHPKVFVSECCDNGPVPVFEDEHIVIVPLLAGDQTTGCPCCLYASPEGTSADQPNTPLIPCGQNEDSSSDTDCSGSSSFSDDTTTRSLGSTPCRDAGGSSAERTGGFKGPCQKTTVSQYAELDAASGVSNGAPATSVINAKSRAEDDYVHFEGHRSVLPLRRKRDVETTSSPPLLDCDETFLRHIRGKLGKARVSKPIWRSEKLSGGIHAASSVKQTDSNAQLSSDGVSPMMPSVKCSVVGFTPCLTAQDDVDESTIAAENLQSHAYKNNGCKESQGCHDMGQTIGSTAAYGCSHEFSDQRHYVVPGHNEHTGFYQSNRLRVASKCNRKTDIAAGLPTRASGAVLSKGPLVHSMRPFNWCISNVQVHELPPLAEGSNPVYAQYPSGYYGVTVSPEVGKYSELDKAGGSASYGEEPDGILGYLCYFRKLDKAVLVVDCKGLHSLPNLRGHPVLDCMSFTLGVSKADETQTIGRTHSIAAVVHLTPYSVVQSREYQQWMHSFRCICHLVMEQNSPEFGFQSSLGTLRKLNNIHQGFFPLPPSLNSCPEGWPASLELSESEVKVVNAELCMGLRFCEDSTTLFQARMDHSGSPFGLKNMSSPLETSRITLEPVLSQVQVEMSNASSSLLLSPDGLAAAGTKRRLLEKKKASFSYGETSAKMNSTTQETAPKSDPLATVKVGGQDSSGLCLIRGKLDSEVGLAFNVHSGVPNEVVVGKQMMNQAEPSRSHGALLQAVAQKQVQEEMRVCELDDEFQLTFLGTGSAEPSKKRGSSSILLQVRGAQGAMLLDAGEGAAGQLIRRFGELGGRAVISSLNCLWLSHKHGDHAFGALSLLQLRSAQAAQLTVIGPHKVDEWLSEVRDTCAASGCPVPGFTYIHCDELSNPIRSMKDQQHAKQLFAVQDAMQLQSMNSVKVLHCYDAYGIVLNGKSGWRVVYSGDTRPCKHLIDAGRGCTLLIHEATFEDSLFEQAKQKRHSTISEAMKVGWHMNAHFIILTHFSQRYPEMLNIQDGQNENISLAFDGMVVPSHLLGSLGKLLPLIRTVFPKPINTSQSNKFPPMPVLVRYPEPRSAAQVKKLEHLNITCAKESPVAKHTRWSSDSDDEEVVVESLQAAIGMSIRWSSYSDEDALFFHKTDQIRRDDVGARTSTITPELNLFGGAGRLSRHAHKEIEGSSAVRTESPESIDNFVKSASAETTESFGAYGGKHLRWVD